MDWNSLKVFLAIVRNGSLSKAALELKVNHSTIFRRLQSFEKELGGQLFDRIDNRYLLTSFGHELLELAQNIENLIGNKTIIQKIALEKYTSATVGLPTLKDIVEELEKPGLDPRGKAQTFNRLLILKFFKVQPIN